jgi:hypothetical protein
MALGGFTPKQRLAMVAKVLLLPTLKKGRVTLSSGIFIQIVSFILTAISPVDLI